MKRKAFITLFLGIHIMFIAFQIDKQSRLVKLSYQKQRIENESQKLLLKKQELTIALHTIKNHTTIKSFAQNELKMNPIDLKKIKRIS